jgi:Tfp pilus assembly protein PilF
MTHLYRLLSCSLLAVFLASCASTERRGDEQSIGEAVQGGSANYKYQAWRPDTSGKFDAIKTLLDEADQLIKNRNYNAAADKLERALRIKPKYAPAWSRLSWLALQTNSPQRAVQMAKRSNSFALSDPALESLNWSFIRTASQTLHDEETYTRANQKIESLKSF